MLRSLSIVLLLASACTKTPPSNGAAPGSGETVGTASAASPASAADVTVSVDPDREPRKEVDIKVGQSFEITIAGAPGVSWKESSDDRSLGEGTPVARVGASVFRWTNKMSQMQVGDHTLPFDGSNGKKVTVVVHVK